MGRGALERPPCLGELARLQGAARGLGLLILLVEAARHHRPGEAGLLLAVFVVGALAVRWLGRDLRKHPSGFPDSTPSHGVHLTGSRLDERRDGR